MQQRNWLVSVLWTAAIVGCSQEPSMGATLPAGDGMGAVTTASPQQVSPPPTAGMQGATATPGTVGTAGTPTAVEPPATTMMPQPPAMAPTPPTATPTTMTPATDSTDTTMAEMTDTSEATPPGMDPGTDTTSAAPNQGLPPVANYGEAGPFETTSERNTGPGNAYTVFRPDPLGTDGFVHSVITFGPGIATSGETSYTVLLTHLASHGYIVISANSFGFSGPGSPAHVDAMREGLEWVIAQGAEAGSPYEGMVAENRHVGMGYSLGATASALLAEHEAVMTTVAIHGHIQMEGGKPHGPILYLTGNGPSAVGDQVMRVVAGLDTAPGLMALYEGQGHLTVIPDQLAAGKPELVAMTAWLRYWVNGDQDAKSHFSGDGCGMCNSDWTLQSNAMWDALSL